MRRLVNGTWERDRSFPTGKSGAFERTTTGFRHWITRDGEFPPEPDRGGVPDPESARLLSEIYVHADPHVSGSVTVPVLWDREIIVTLNDAFDGPDLAPGVLRDEMASLNDRIYADRDRPARPGCRLPCPGQLIGFVR